LSTIFSIIAGIAAIWSAVYAISFAVNEFRTKRPAGGITALLSVVAMVWTFIKGAGV